MKRFTSVLVLAMLVTLAMYTPVAEAATTKNSQRTTKVTTVKSKSPKVINPPVVVSPLVTDDFENSLSSNWVREMANSTYSGTFSTNYAQSGSRSLRIELRNTDADVNGSKRSEIAIAKSEASLQEHTYNFSTLLPNGGAEDYALDPEGSEIIAQWHNVPDPGEEWTVPPLALRTINGRYVLERYWDDAKLSTTDEIKQKGNHALHDLGSYVGDKGKWVTWSYHIKWGWLASQAPTLEVYKNGVKILDLKGLPNTTNDFYGNKMKLGIYKWDWAHPELKYSILTKRVIYYDKVSII